MRHRLASIVPGSTDRSGPGLPGIVATAALAVALVAVSGPVGLAIAAVAAGAWLLAPAPYAIAVGHAGLLALGPAELDPGSVLVAEVGFLAVLLADLAARPNARAAAGAAAVTLAVTGVVAVGTLTVLPLWGAGAAVLLTLATIGYAVHRFQLVHFGLVGDDEEDRDAGPTGAIRRRDGPDTPGSGGGTES